MTRGTAGATGLSSVTWGAGTFVAVGSAGNTIRSTNGTSWSRTQIPANQSSTGSSPGLNQVAYANNHFIATASSGQAYISTDGVNWQEKYTGVGRIFTGSTVANGLCSSVRGRSPAWPWRITHPTSPVSRWAAR